MRVKCWAPVFVVPWGCGDTCAKPKPPPIEPLPAPTPWPAIPRSAEEADALVAKHTKRAIVAPRELDVARMLEKDGAVGGWPAIFAWLRGRMGTGDAWVLVGTHHDSAAPVDAFRRLLGPDVGIAWTRIVLEQLRADGEWEGLDHEAQRGDTSDLFQAARGSDEAFRRLLAAQESHDYAAWKYDYARDVLDVVT